MVTRASSSGPENPDPGGSAYPERSPDPGGSAYPGVDWNSLVIGQGEHLPHWTCDNAIYHISFRLADSVPAAQREHWLRERQSIIDHARSLNRPLSEDEENRLRFLYSDRIEAFLDQGHGECHLARPEAAEIVAATLRHFDDDRYRLHAWAVMPNHVHSAVQPLPGHDLSDILHSWKTFTARRINALLGRSGDFWQRDSYNHIIRNPREYAFQLRYIWENPDQAGLRNWPWRWLRPR